MPKLAYSVTEQKEGREVEMMLEGSGRREGRKGRKGRREAGRKGKEEKGAKEEEMEEGRR